MEENTRHYMKQPLDESMQSKTLVTVSFVLSLIGLALIFLSVSLIEVRHVQLSVLSQLSQNDRISATGIVQDVKFDGRNLFFTMDDGTASVKVVIFESALSKLDLYGTDIKNGDNVTVQGMVQTYKGSLEIVADRLYLASG